MKRKKLLILSILAIAFLSNSCKKEDRIIGKYENGAFITNEGGWGSSNASVSFLNFATNSIEDNIFTLTNGRPLGDVLQSAYKANNEIFLVLNSSNKVEVVNSYDFKEVGTIEGIDSPRYLLVVGENAYITQWGDDGKVKVADISTLKVTNTIDVGTGPEGMILANGFIWVANGGGTSVDSTISVIDPFTSEVVKTIKVGHNPKKMVKDVKGNIWALCYGYIKYKSDWSIELETPSRLVEISSTTKEVLKSFIISTNQHPSQLDISSNGQTLYYGGGFGYNGVFEFNISDTSLPSTPLINASFYSFNVNSANDELFCLEAISFTNPGKLKRYSSSGELINEYAVGIGPNGVVF